VRVDDIDPQGKVSLSLVGDNGDEGDAPAPARRPARPERPERAERSEPSRAAPEQSMSDSVSFEDAFEAEVRETYGDLGPASTPAGSGGGGRGDGGGPRRNRRRGPR
jgi:polyribonucleotide nucleotidyltransferase